MYHILIPAMYNNFHTFKNSKFNITVNFWNLLWLFISVKCTFCVDQFDLKSPEGDLWAENKRGHNLKSTGELSWNINQIEANVCENQCYNKLSLVFRYFDKQIINM